MRLAPWLVAAAVVCASLPQAAAKPVLKQSRQSRVHRRGRGVPWLAVQGTQLTQEDGRGVVLRGFPASPAAMAECLPPNHSAGSIS